MRLQEDLDFTTLNWVKQELDETLKQARQALEAYVEDPADASLMRFCATYLHQVQGTLRMVELYGAAMVVEEMERVANALLDTQIRQRDDAYAVLMRGIVQLPDYLERLQSGHKDIPIVLLPLLNDLRACRGEKLLSESVLFSPDLAAPLPPAAAGPERAVPELELRAQAGRLRTNFQSGLLHWFRNTNPTDAIRTLNGVLDRLRGLTTVEEARRVWWVAGGVLDAIRDGGVESSAALKLLIGRVDREIKRLADVGEQSFRVDPPRELSKNLLYYIAHSTARGERVQEIRRTYKLDSLLPTERELEHAKGALGGRNRALLDTVSAAIKEDLMRVKDALDLHLRSPGARAGELTAQGELLDRVADTLGMLGLGVPRRVVQEQRQALAEIAAGTRAADEGSLLDVAGALLYVEASLDDNIASLGASAEAEPEPSVSTEVDLPQTEVRRILDALMKEAAVNLQQAKHDVVAFVEAPWDHDKIAGVPKLVEEIAGAMRMLNLEAPAELLEALKRFIEVELIRLKRVPTQDQMDRLADSLASIEYYLEAARDQRGGREKILDVTRRSLESLGYWPLPSAALTDGGSELDEIAGAALEAAPVPKSRGVADPSTALDTLSFAVPTETRSEALRAAQVEGEGEVSSVDLPSEDLDRFVARIGTPHEPPPAPSAPASVRGEDAGDYTLAVELAPGKDLGDLIVGEAATAPVAPPPQNVDGMRLAETAPGAQMPGVDGDEWEEVEEQIEEEVEVPVAGTGSASFQAVASDEIDDEIREVFVEEVQEEIDNIRRQLPAWKADLADAERLKPIRRSFHTLKGSGRLVGAMALGEFSWKIENLLNRVLDKSVAPSPAVVALLDHATAALPQLLGALRGEGAPRVDLAQIVAVAEKLAAGEQAWFTAPEVQKQRVTRTVRVRRLKPKATLAAPVELTEVLDITQPLTEEPGAIDFGTIEFTSAAIEAIPEPATPAPAPISETESVLEAAADITPPPAAPVRPAVVPLASVPAARAESAPRMPEIDPLLLEILRSEASGHLATIDAYLADASATQTPSPVPETLLRAVHTLHGAVAMSEVPVITDVVAPLEGYLKRLRAARAAPEPEGLTALAEATAVCHDVVARLDRPGEALARPDLLVARLMALRDGLPEPSSPHQAFGLGVEDDEGIESEESVAAIADAAPESAMDDDGFAVEATAFSDFPPEAATSSASAGDELAALASIEAALAADLGDAGASLTIEPTLLGDIDIETPATESAIEIPALEFAPADSANDATPGETEIVLADLEPAAIAVEPESALELPTNEPVEAIEAIAVEPPLEIAAVPEPPAEIVLAAPVAPTAPAAAEVPRSAAPAPAEDLDPDGPLELADIDDELLDIFVEEGGDILDQADALVARLREAPTESETIVGLQRHLHTIKGNARAVSLGGIGDLAHVMESLLEGAAADRLHLGRTGIEALERGFDKLHRMVGRVGKRLAVGVPHHAIARLEALAAETPVGSPAPAPMMAPQVAAVAPEPATAAAAAPVRAAEPVPPRPAARTLPEPFEDETLTRAPQEMIRVRSDLLDALVNFAGEVSIYRSRLEQQMGSYRFNLVELDQTVLRLREQLRKLELETEAQILSRFQREAESGRAEASFDPLELDRYSTLQQLSRALAESVSDLQSLQNALDDLTRQAETLLLQQSRVSSELQEGLMRTRMVPFDSVVPFLRRLVRQTSDELGKRAALRIEGAQGEMDRNLLERMKAPFEHMLRNALAHGIEQPWERSAAGKPEEGTVRIAVSREATEVVIRVSDDGKGMDRDAIKRKAIERGLMRADAQLSDRDLFAFVLETGFSTAEQVTKISGRGVGMDVVASEIKQLGGSLSIDSQRGRGTEFIIRLPFTLAVTQAILVRLGEQAFAVPMSSVQGVARIARDDLDRRLAQPNLGFSYAGEEYTIHELNSLLGVPGHRATDEAQLPLLLARTGDQRAAVRVDAVMGSREIVVKSVGPQVSSVPGIFGATIMGDGSVVMILDLAPLVRRSAALREESAVEAAIEAAMPGLVEQIPVAATEPRRRPLIMVVDDSITMRKVTSRVLERNDMEVVTAKDGLDAVEKLQDRIPDLVLLDIEMPRMDGYELATYMRNDPRLRTVPIIMITSRTGEKHRQRAFEIGVDRYLGKPYQEADLLRNVEETLRLSRAVH
jgi:chemosensory pili system protein ChpA (sensor histidine kinase/response regulator)